ncbi:MAG: DegV family protein [Oscillospiraceae bacterium]|nr:DegV family protein [Oscillospiraceae bacterium]
MSDFRIVTDSGSDLNQCMIDQLNISLVPLMVNFKGTTQPDNVDDGISAFYDGLRAGEVATTSAINPTGWATKIEPILAGGQDVLVIGFSSGLSTTYQSAVIAAEELKEKYPERNIRVVDSLCASLGQGLLVWYACKKRDEGMSLNDLADWLENNKLHLCHWFTVDDLMYLKRGGRVSAATALVGTMLQIKPVLHVDDEGHLINVSKVRGRKASIEAIAKKLGELGIEGENSTVFICHGDCIEDAQHLASIVKERYGVKEVFIGHVGTVIGSHSGPGTLALFFLGTHR